jgi:hypothetical protein
MICASLAFSIVVSIIAAQLSKSEQIINGFALKINLPLEQQLPKSGGSVV